MYIWLKIITYHLLDDIKNSTRIRKKNSQSMARGLPSCDYFKDIFKGHIYPSDRKQDDLIFHRRLHFLFLKVKFYAPVFTFKLFF